MRFIEAAIVMVVGCSVGFFFGVQYGKTVGRQSVVPVACEPVVKGLRKNGKEIPLTSAQRDSLSGAR